MKIKFILSTLFIMINFSTMAQDTKRPEMGFVCKAFSGQEGFYIVTFRIGPESNNEVLIGFNNIDHPWNRKIFKAKVIKKSIIADDNFGFEYTITEGAKKYTVFTFNKTEGYKMYLKSYGSTTTIHTGVYNKAVSEDCDPEFLLTQYLQQNN